MLEREIVFDDFQVGMTFPPYDFVVTAADRADFEAATGSTPPLTRNGRAWTAPDEAAEDGPRPLPALLLNTFKIQRAVMRMPEGVLHAREVLHLHGPAFEDEPLRMTLTVRDAYRKKERPFVVFDMPVVRRSDSAPILTVERTLCWPR